MISFEHELGTLVSAVATGEPRLCKSCLHVTRMDFALYRITLNGSTLVASGDGCQECETYSLQPLEGPCAG